MGASGMQWEGKAALPGDFPRVWRAGTGQVAAVEAGGLRQFTWRL